jgi:hypothetical protein
MRQSRILPFLLFAHGCSGAAISAPMKTTISVLLVVAIWGLTSASAGPAPSAPARVGSIAGTLRDEQGQVFPHVSVLIGSAPDADTRNVGNSDAAGRYVVDELPPGTYSLRFELLRRHDPNSRARTGRGRVDCATRDKVVVKAGRRTRLDAVVRYCGEYTYEVIRSY